MDKIITEGVVKDNNKEALVILVYRYAITAKKFASTSTKPKKEYFQNSIILFCFQGRIVFDLKQNNG
jgi:hypothetical protein